MAQGDAVFYVGIYSRSGGIFTGKLDKEDEDTADIVEAMEGENEVKSANLQAMFYFVKNTVQRIVGNYNVSIKADIYLHIDGKDVPLKGLLKRWQVANGQPTKLDRKEAWRDLPAMLADGTIPEEGEFSFRYRPFRFANKAACTENRRRLKQEREAGLMEADPEVLGLAAMLDQSSSSDEASSDEASGNEAGSSLAAMAARLSESSGDESSGDESGEGAAKPAEDTPELAENPPAEENSSGSDADDEEEEEEEQEEQAQEQGNKRKRSEEPEEPEEPEALEALGALEDFLTFYPSRLRDLKLDELKDLFVKIGCNGRMPKKPKKLHYQTAVRKDVRQLVAVMTQERQKQWLEKAEIEYSPDDDLSQMIIDSVM